MHMTVLCMIQVFRGVSLYISQTVTHILPQIAKTLRSTSIRYQFDTKVLDQCLINVYPWVFAIWGTLHGMNESWQLSTIAAGSMETQRITAFWRTMGLTATHDFKHIASQNGCESQFQSSTLEVYFLITADDDDQQCNAWLVGLWPVLSVGESRHFYICVNSLWPSDAI